MVRTVADRAFLPAKSLFEQVGNMMMSESAVSKPSSYGSRLRGEPIVTSDLNEQRLSGVDRLAAGFLLLLLAVGSLALWILVPAAWLWVASKITDSGTSHFLASILGMPLVIIVFGVALAWVNRLYMRVVWTGPPVLPEPGEEAEEERFPRGPLEPLLVASLIVAIAAFVFWFLVLAEDPPSFLFSG